MQLFLHHTRKNALASLHPLLFRINSVSFVLPRYLKAQFICISVIVSAVFLHLLRKMEERKEIQFNEWKFMHMKTSNNSSNQSDFNKRFSFVYFVSAFCVAEHCLKREEKNRSVSGFWWQKEICDDIHLNKQLNEAERFMIFLLPALLSSLRRS